MSWDAEWENVFQTRGWNRYPAEQVIRFVAQNFYHVPDRKKVKILELGCAEGNNIWFLAREGFEAYGVDGSPTAIDKAERRLGNEGLQAHLQVADVARLGDLYSGERFDAILDAGCLTCNPISFVKEVIDQLPGLLKPAGKVYSMSLAAGTYGSALGEEIEPGTVKGITDGALKGVGTCHFFTIEEIEQLFSPFSNLQIEFTQASRDNQRQLYKHWIVSGEI